MRNTQKFNESLDACGMRKIFEAYNVTVKDLKPGKPEWKQAYICRKGNVTFIYKGEYKKVFLHMKTNIGSSLHIDPRGHYWFLLGPHKITKRDLLNLDVEPILEVLSIIGTELYVTKDPTFGGFKLIDRYEDGAVNLKDLPMLAHTL